MSESTAYNIDDTNNNNINNNNPAIPIIDISALIEDSKTPSSQQQQQQLQAVANQIKAACQNIGFFVITNHGISQSTISELLDSSKQFFDLPVDDKMMAATDDEVRYPYGYERSEMLERGKRLDGVGDGAADADGADANKQCKGEHNTTPAQSDAPDPKETYSIGPLLSPSGEPWRRYPPTTIRPPDMVSTHDAYYAEMEVLAHNLLRGFAMALDLDDDGWFDDKFDEHQCALRTLNYPRLVIDDVVEGRDGENSCTNSNRSNKAVRIRAGAHTDYGAFTILYSGGPGLQVKKDDVDDNGDADSGWIDVPDVANAFIVNIGDMMRRWTNDVWVSTLHRVIVPTGTNDGAAEDADADADADMATQVVERRQSVAFFVNANGDAVVEPIPTCVTETNPARYEAVTAGEYLMRKHLASMGKDI